jgi:DNA replication regulator DPB11
VQNGAEYHGDLTKSVTHLIAAAPLGKKYEHATNWKMKIVTWEWFEQSVRRGMVLDESCYLPTMPIEERGRGAWDRRRSPSPTLGKRTREVEEAQLVNPLRRKLRRSASSKMGSQIEALWAGITAGGTEIQRNDEDEWTETAPAKTSLSTTTAPAIDANNMAGVQDGAFREDAPALLLAEPPHQNDGIFQGRLVFTYGFDTEKVCFAQSLDVRNLTRLQDEYSAATSSQ